VDASRPVQGAAMTTFERTATIPAGPHAVWETLADLASISSWAPDVDHSCLVTEQTTGVGAARRVQVGRTTLVETVETWEPGSTLAYRISGLPPIVRSVVNRWSLVADGSGTRATLTTAIETGSKPPQRLLAVLIGRKLVAASEGMLAGLAAHFARQETPS
jgi:uncharacterized protein YndB with AHSA1/START domain